jgi:transketolase
MRNAFAAAVTALADDPRVVLLSGDIGNRLFDDFKRRAPERFFNCGVAEANMTTMAAGMALCGLRPFTYTIAAFATARALEQIRIDVCYHNVPVVVVGTGSGLSYASLGPTHHCLEDLAMLRALPNVAVVCPADAAEVRAAVPALLRLDGPAYLRLGKKGEPSVHREPPAFVIGRGIIVREGDGACLLGTGTGVALALEAAALLERNAVSPRVVSMHTVKPLDEGLLGEAFDRFDVVAVIEEHGLVGGLGGAVAEWLARRPVPARARLLAFGTADAFVSQAGGQPYARRQLGLEPDLVAVRVLAALTHKAPAPC